MLKLRLFRTDDYGSPSEAHAEGALYKSAQVFSKTEEVLDVLELASVCLGVAIGAHIEGTDDFGRTVNKCVEINGDKQRDLAIF